MKNNTEKDLINSLKRLEKKIDLAINDKEEEVNVIEELEKAMKGLKEIMDITIEKEEEKKEEKSDEKKIDDKKLKKRVVFFQKKLMSLPKKDIYEFFEIVKANHRMMNELSGENSDIVNTMFGVLSLFEEMGFIKIEE